VCSSSRYYSNTISGRNQRSKLYKLKKIVGNLLLNTRCWYFPSDYIHIMFEVIIQYEYWVYYIVLYCALKLSKSNLKFSPVPRIENWHIAFRVYLLVMIFMCCVLKITKILILMRFPLYFISILKYSENL